MNCNPYELLYMSRTGDQSAVLALFSLYDNYLQALVKSAIGNNTALQIYEDDLRQSARIAFLDAIETYREDRDASFITFANCVMRRRIWNHMRSYHAVTRVGSHNPMPLDMMINEQESTYDVIPQRNPMNDPVYYTAYNDAKERVHRCLAGLNELDYKVAQSVLRDESYEKAAERLHCTKRAYDGKAQRVRRLVRQAIRAEKTHKTTRKIKGDCQKL